MSSQRWPLDMSQDKAREIALGAARSEFRRMGINPVSQSADDALLMLDDLSRSEPLLIASQWHRLSSDAQTKKFVRDWDRWVKSQQGFKS